MKYTIVILFSIILFSSCDVFTIEEKKDVKSEIIAIVNTEKLFKEDIKSILPENVSKQDSIIIVSSFVKDWAVKRLLLDKAKKNSSLESVNEIDNLVKDYKESLLINNYKEELVKQQLDTIITEEEIVFLISILKQKNDQVKFLGTTTAGEIIDGEVGEKSLVVSITEFDETIVHYGYFVDNGIVHDKNVICHIDTKRRLNLSRNHTATHLVNKILRELLNDSNLIQKASFSVRFKKCVPVK